MASVTLPRSGVASDAGLERRENEDRVYADDAAGVFVVVDGLGGHAAGEKAAQTAVDVISRELAACEGSLEECVRAAITAANNEIFNEAQGEPKNAGMACVLTVALVRGGTVTVGHVGDSRLYLIWNGTARKVTLDHSPVGEQEDQGELTETEAMSHPRRNEVFRDVGSRLHAGDDVDFIDVRSFPFHPAAALLLCTDGLSDALTSAEIAAIVDAYDGDASAIASLLVESANRRGGHDNVSVVFVPGPEFIGARSSAMAEARARHAITRMRTRRAAWKRIAARAMWVLLGMILGMMLWAALERMMTHAEQEPAATPVSWRQ
jgi:serine/threonine protein phosphatase PrpC